jgi:hypothetical protein
VLSSTDTKEEGRPLVCYTPIWAYNVDGWDSGVGTETIFFPRERTKEPFYSWGVTEKVELEKAFGVHQLLPNLPAAAAIALPGLVEEVAVIPEDLRMLRRKEGAKYPFKSSDLELVTVRPFSVEITPIGIIHNLERPDSPIVMVSTIVIYGGGNLGSRETESCIAGPSPSGTALFKAVSGKKDLDSWSRAVALSLVENFQLFRSLDPVVVEAKAYKALFKNLDIHQDWWSERFKAYN